MKLLKRILFGLIGLILIAAVTAYVWFWGRPVGLNNYINKVTIEAAMTSPETMTRLGLIDNTPLDFHSGKLDGYTPEVFEGRLKKFNRARKGLDRYGPEGLEGQELISWQLAAHVIDGFIWENENQPSIYWVNHLLGPTADVPQFLTDDHVIKDKKSAERYLSRVEDFERVLNEVHELIDQHRQEGFIPPAHIIDLTLDGMRKFIDGGVDENILVTTLPERLKDAGISEKDSEKLISQVRVAVETGVIPGYEELIDLFEDMKSEASEAPGIWQQPNGPAIYSHYLRENTTTDLTADEIFDLGMREVSRLEAELDQALTLQGWTEGTVGERLSSLTQDPAYHFDTSEKGRAAVIETLTRRHDALMGMAPEYFSTLPKARMQILAVPEYLEDSQSLAYYSPGALDGSRPGKVYVNLRNPKEFPLWSMPTVLYHEGSPGHHFQFSAAQEITGVPILRQIWGVNAYNEGWALYSERMIDTDFDLYKDDPLGNIGRLQAELWRAVRLVVDTGIHHKKWSREEAVQFMVDEVGFERSSAETEIDRYTVRPGQATGYMIGLLTILEWRERAETALGDDFDIKSFHEVILGNGALPFFILEDIVDDWIETQAK